MNEILGIPQNSFLPNQRLFSEIFWSESRVSDIPRYFWSWRMCIPELYSLLCSKLAEFEEGKDNCFLQDIEKDPIYLYGREEAEKQFYQGKSPGGFIELLGISRLKFRDLVSGADEEQATRYHAFLENFFNRLERGFCETWLSLKKEDCLETTILGMEYVGHH